MLLRKIYKKTGEAVFVLSTQTITASRENGYWYGETVSGRAIYTYTDGNPVNLIDPSGKCPWCLAGAILGAGANLGYQLYQNGGNWGQVDIQQVGLAGAAGLLGGGLGTATAALTLRLAMIANMAGGAAISGLQQVASNGLQGKNLDCGVAEHAAWGGAFGGLGTLGAWGYNAVAANLEKNLFINTSNSISGPFYPGIFSPNNIYAGGTAGANAVGNAIPSVYQW